MRDSRKTKAQLMVELVALRRRVSELEGAMDPPGGTAINGCPPPLEGMSEGYYEIDLDATFTFVNQALCDIQGYRPEELLGKDSRQFIPPRHTQKVIDFFDRVYSTGRPGRLRDYEFIHKDGRIRYIDLSAALLRDADGKTIGFRGIARDRTNEYIRQSELERYRDFVESVDDGCFEVDLDGTLTFINSAMCQIHGYPFEELWRMNHRDFAAPEDARAIFEVFNSIYQSGRQARIFDYNIIQKNGAVRNLEVSASLIQDSAGNAIGFRGISRDRTDRKKRERELERYRAFVEGVREGCFEVDLKGNITFCNDAACRLFGYSTEQFMGMNNRNYTTFETARRIYQIFNRIFRTGQPEFFYDYEVRRGDGQLCYLDVNVTLIKDEQGKPVGFRGVCKDVTERKHREAEKERLATLLNQAQRLEAIGTLAGGVAHNFNNLLMSIQGFVSLIFLDIQKGHPHYNRLKTIEDLITRGAELTTKLLGYARHGRYATQPTPVRDVLSAAVAWLKSGQNQVQVIIDIPEAIWPVAADRDQMEQVARNLLINAGEAMPEGGVITIEGENRLLRENQVKAFNQKPGPYVKLRVADTGFGMDQATRERIFEPFFSTKPVNKGAGLGLALAHGIINRHGGFILVDSEIGKGTAFSVYWPALPKGGQEREGAKGLPQTVLLVDDDRAVREMIAQKISPLGYHVITANNGVAALEIFHTDPGQIDLVIIDMVMPGLSGDKVIRSMRAVAPDIKIILMSGFTESDAVQAAMRDTRQAFLQKPFQLETLSNTIRQLLEA